MMEQVTKCPVCGRPYVVYSHFAGNQSACKSCVSQAYRNEKPTDFRDYPRESQQEYFGINRSSSANTDQRDMLRESQQEYFGKK